MKGGKQKYSEKNLSHSHFFRQKSTRPHLGSNVGLCSGKQVINRLSRNTDLMWGRNITWITFINQVRTAQKTLSRSVLKKNHLFISVVQRNSWLPIHRHVSHRATLLELQVCWYMKWTLIFEVLRSSMTSYTVTNGKNDDHVKHNHDNNRERWLRY